MPVIIVHNAFGHDPPRLDDCYGSDLGSHHRRKSALAAALRKAVMSVTELGPMKAEDIAFFMPEGYASPAGLTLISVDVLFASDLRTREVREKLADALKTAATACYETYHGRGYQIEVAVKRFDPKTDVYL